MPLIARGGDAWMLGCFVLPIARLKEAGRLLTGRFDADCPLRISALGTKTATADAFLENLRAGLHALAVFQKEHGAAVSVEQLEAPLPSDATPGPALDSLLWEAACLIGGSPGRARNVAGFLGSAFLGGFTGTAARNRRAQRLGLLTGRPTPFPRSAPLPAVRREAADGRGGKPPRSLRPRNSPTRSSPRATPGVALKFTAGPASSLPAFRRGRRRLDARIRERLRRRGFSFARSGSTGRGARNLLEDEDPASFRFDAAGLQWLNSWRVPTDAISAAREFITSFGSCSFDEPRDDLRRLGMLA